MSTPASLTIKPVAKTNPTEPARIQIGENTYNFQTIQRAINNAANAPADSEDTYVVNAVEVSGSAAGTPVTVTATA